MKGALATKASTFAIAAAASALASSKSMSARTTSPPTVAGLRQMPSSDAMVTPACGLIRPTSSRKAPVPGLFRYFRIAGPSNTSFGTG